MTNIKEIVRSKYGEAARQAKAGHSATCGCSSSCCDTITSNIYGADETTALPPEADVAIPPRSPS